MVSSSVWLEGLGDDGSPTHEIRTAVLAGAWIPFLAVIGFIILFAVMFVRMYQHKYERDIGSAIAAMTALIVSLLSVAIIPVDIYLVSSFKGSDGTFHSWASSENRDSIATTVRDGYIVFYALACFFAFFVLPMAYFYFEERDDIVSVPMSKRLVKALMYTSVMLLIMAVLLCIGAFAFSNKENDCTSSADPKCDANFAKNAITHNTGSKALEFTICALTLVGCIFFIYYTGYGMVSFGLNMIWSRNKYAREDREEAAIALNRSREAQRTIASKYQSKAKVSERDRDRLMNEEHTERVISRATEEYDSSSRGCCNKLSACLAPFRAVFGVFFLLFSWLLIVTLALSCGDMLVQIGKQHLSFENGYTLVSPKLENPIDKILVLMQHVFPLDYVFMGLIVYYFVMCTISGIRHLGVRFCCVKMYPVEPSRTVPQGLLTLCFIVLLVVLAINAALFTLSPRYVRFGSQKYPSYTVSNLTVSSDTLFAVDYPSGNVVECLPKAPAFIYKIVSGPTTYQIENTQGYTIFNSSAPNGCSSANGSYCLLANGATTCTTVQINAITCQQEDTCVSTRLSALKNMFFEHGWFFSAVFFWSIWGLIIDFVLSFFYLTCRGRRSAMQALVNRADADADYDEEIVPFNPAWTRR